jgi:hypothetical protein
MRRIRQGVATEAYWASTVRERPTPGRNTLPGVPSTADKISLDRHVGHNSAGEGSDGHGWPSAAEGMDAWERPGLECNRICETQH